MKTFTFIMELRGGTYISQVKSVGLSDAIVQWGSQLNIDEIKYFSHKTKDELIGKLHEDSPAPIEGIKAVWVICYTLQVGFAMVNIVQTDTGV